MSPRLRRGQCVEIPLQQFNRMTSRDSNNYRPDTYWKDVFNRYDLDSSGTISFNELKAMINSREYKYDIPDWVVDRVMSIADRDHNGFLDFEEFLNMVQNPDLKNVFKHWLQRYILMFSPNLPPVPMEMSSTDRLQGDVYANKEDDDYDGLYEEAYSCSPLPICLFMVSIVEIVLFIVDYNYCRRSVVNGPIAVNLRLDPSRRIEIWRFLSYMFVHESWIHLTTNLIIQVLLGIPLEMVHKWWRVLLVYSSGVVAGSLATSVVGPEVSLVGASGGVYALIAAHMSTLILNWSEMEFATVQLLILLLYGSLDIGAACYIKFHLKEVNNVGYVAHLAGAIAGLLVGIAVLKNLKVKPWERHLQFSAVIVSLIFMAVCIMIHVFWTSHFSAFESSKLSSNITVIACR